jgi:MazG family protein
MVKTIEDKSISDKSKALEKLEKLVARLRGEGGCPWDRKQTPASMRIYLIEEMYELIDALDREDDAGVLEELGDVLFQVFFMARLFEEKGLFSILDVADKNTEKMTGRHPHVFGDITVKDAADVRSRWHTFKKGSQNINTVLASVPRSLPSLLLAYRVCERVSRVGVDACPGKGPEEVIRPSVEAFLQAAQDSSSQKELTEERLGDMLFAVCGLSHRLGIHPDTALKQAVERFAEGFSSDRQQDDNDSNN